MPREGLSGTLRDNIAALAERQRGEHSDAPFSERVANRIARFIGSMTFVVVHVVIVALWLSANLGWLPAEAGIVAENWNLPAARVKLGVPYARVLGGARALWRDGAFDLTLEARAEPEADTKTKAPPFAARIAARGTLRELTVTALTVDAPFATAQLTAPVTFSPDRPEAGVAAKLNVLVDLA